MPFKILLEANTGLPLTFFSRNSCCTPIKNEEILGIYLKEDSISPWAMTLPSSHMDVRFVF